MRIRNRATLVAALHNDERVEAQRLGITVNKLAKEERPEAERLGITVDDLVACRLHGLTAAQKQQLDELSPPWSRASCS